MVAGDAALQRGRGGGSGQSECEAGRQRRRMSCRRGLAFGAPCGAPTCERLRAVRWLSLIKCLTAPLPSRSFCAREQGAASSQRLSDGQSGALGRPAGCLCPWTQEWPQPVAPRRPVPPHLRQREVLQARQGRQVRNPHVRHAAAADFESPQAHQLAVRAGGRGGGSSQAWVTVAACRWSTAQLPPARHTRT